MVFAAFAFAELAIIPIRFDQKNTAKRSQNQVQTFIDYVTSKACKKHQTEANRHKNNDTHSPVLYKASRDGWRANCKYQEQEYLIANSVEDLLDAHQRKNHKYRRYDDAVDQANYWTNNG